jgi:predicted RND superfamily exporter protein
MTSDIAARALWRFRLPLLALAVLMTVIAGYQLASLSVSNSLDVWYPADDPELLNYQRFLDTYGSDEIVIVAVSSPEQVSFESDDGAFILSDLTALLLDVEGVADVTSLATIPESLDEARDRLLGDDSLVTALIVQTTGGADFEARRPAMLREIRESASELGLESRLAGFGVVYDGLNTASTAGAAKLITAAHLVMLILLIAFFRRAVPVVATLTAVGFATIWTMGLYAALGHQLNMVTMALPTLVLVIGIADCLHMFRSVDSQDPSYPRNERAIRGLADVIGPCFLTSVSTAAGFLALTTSDLPVVHQLGAFGAIGMIAAFLASILIVPAGLGWTRATTPHPVSALSELAARLARIGMHRPRTVTAAFVIAAALAVIGLGQLETDTNSIAYLKKTHQVRQDSDYIEATIGPWFQIEFTATTSDAVMSGPVLDAIWHWQRAASDIDKVGWSWSLIDALNVGTNEVPSRVGIKTLQTELTRLRIVSPPTIAAMLAGENELRILFGVPMMSARSVQDLIGKIVAAADLPADISLRPAGYSPLYTRIVDEVVQSQVRGFAAAIGLIVLLLGLAMRSWRRVLLALPANILPVVLTLGLMGLAGIPLDIATATIASVILGLVVDDTIHILRPSASADIEESLQLATAKAGGTLLMTTATLALGFVVLGLAEVRSIAWFGLLASFAVTIAILTDLLLLPALARLFRN